MAVEHEIRSRTGGTQIVENYTHSKAIRVMCEECQGWESIWTETLPDGSKVKHDDILECPSTKCPLWPFRGHSRLDLPKREVDEEERQMLAERLKKAREARNPKEKP